MAKAVKMGLKEAQADAAQRLSPPHNLQKVCERQDQQQEKSPALSIK